MSWLPLYADATDIAEVLAYLNDDEECAFVIADGSKRWKAVKIVPRLDDGRHCLWIHSGGPLPLLRPNHQPDQLIPDPWNGWTELRSGADPSQPFFGAGHPAVVWFNVRARARSAPDAIGMSAFEWIGNHYRIIGSPAPDCVMKWWQRLGRRVKKSAKRVPRSGPLDGPGAEIWALPSAHARLVNGAARDVNP